MPHATMGHTTDFAALVPFFDIDDVEELLVLHEPLGILQQQVDRMLALALRVPRDVRRDDDVRMGPQSMPIRKGFGIRDIESRASQAVVQRMQQVI